MTIINRAWSTLFDTPPDAGHGVAIAELAATQPDARIVVEFAVVNATHVSDPPTATPVWIDITGRVIDILIRQGDATRETRWPAGQLTINCERFDDLLVHDPFSDSVHPNNRAGCASLIRVGFRNLHASVDGAAVPAGTRWDGLFAGQVEMMTELDTGGDGRWWAISALDGLYRMGQPLNYSWLGNGHDAEARINSILSPSVSGLMCPYTSDVRIAATLLQEGLLVNVGDSALRTLHRIGDTCRARMYHNGAGTLVIRTVGIAADYPARWSVLDDPGATVVGRPAVPQPAYAIKPTRIVMATGADRITLDTRAAAPPLIPLFYGGWPTGLTFGKFRFSNDTNDWPRGDLLSNSVGDLEVAAGQFDAARWAETSRLDTVTFDTQPATVRTDGAADIAALDARLTPLTQYCAFLARHGVDTRYTFERRGRGPVAFYRVDFEVHQVEHYLERTNNLFRWRSVHGGKAMYP